MERRVKRELPKLNEMLRQRIGEWERSHGAFLYEGESYLERMDKEVRGWVGGWVGGYEWMRREERMV
jgi:hypothetical protein